MAKNTKRTERMNQSDHNVNRAMLLLTVGIVAEFYLLMVNNYFVKGGVSTVLAMMTVLEVIGYIGCALVGAGLVFWITRKQWTRFARLAPWLLSAGVFFAVSSRLMLTRRAPRSSACSCRWRCCWASSSCSTRASFPCRRWR